VTSTTAAPAALLTPERAADYLGVPVLTLTACGDNESAPVLQVGATSATDSKTSRHGWQHKQKAGRSEIERRHKRQRRGRGRAAREREVVMSI
jgi:hypothetical protein